MNKNMIYNCNDLEIISKLRNENRYLKDEIKEETGKLRNTIKVLNKEIENIKKDNHILNGEIEHLLNKEVKHFQNKGTF
jgi:phosphoglycerate-specific signal transduction histidine kinase|tara:strand:- start:1283 stop:1519 length:237 start_codon:yes stop_codon:yes gene_type:complete